MQIKILGSALIAKDAVSKKDVGTLMVMIQVVMLLLEEYAGLQAKQMILTALIQSVVVTQNLVMKFQDKLIALVHNHREECHVYGIQVQVYANLPAAADLTHIIQPTHA